MVQLVDELLERLSRISDFSEACSLVCERVLAEHGFERALVLVRAGEETHAAGWRLREERVAEAITSAHRPTAPLASALLSQTVILADGRRDPLLDFSAYAVLPFLGYPGEGAVVLEADQLDERTDAIAAEFRRYGPVLLRCMRLELLTAGSQRLARQRDLLTNVVDALSDPVLLTDAENRILLTNRRAEELFSADESASHGRRRAVQINNLLFSSFLTQSVIGTRGAAGRELNLVHPTDGSDLLFEVLSARMAANGSAPELVISILRDITDLKRAVTELESQFLRSRSAEHRSRQESDRLNVILENVSDPILVTDGQSNIILMNREAERLFEVAEAGHGRSDRLIRANDTKFTTLISNFLLQGVDRQVEGLDLADPVTGRTFPVELASSKILDERGEPIAMVSVIHDLTQVAENKRLAAELRKFNEQLEERIRRAIEQLEERNRQLEWQSQQLEQASRLKSEFLANMSHELRTPLNVLLGYASLMRERIYGELSKQQDIALERITVSSQHLLALINDILDLSKIEAGKMPVNIEAVRLEALVGELSATIEPLLESKPLAFSTQLAPELPTLQTDHTKLRQIMLNLLSNAIKFTPAGSVSIQAESTQGGASVRIAVVDTGIGIPPEHLGTIFESFRQLDQSPTREYGGSGLGLSITKKLLALLGGRISVASTLGQGSRFTIELPVVLELRDQPWHVIAEAEPEPVIARPQ